LKRSPIYSKIHRTLVRRIALVTVVIAVILAELAMINQRERMEEGVADLARSKIQRFNYGLLPLFDRSHEKAYLRMQAELDKFSSSSGDTMIEDGRFVAVRIYDDSGLEIARMSDATFLEIDTVESAMDADEPDPPGPDGFRIITVDLKGSPYVGVDLPLLDSNDEMVGHIEIVFAISTAAMEKFHRSMLRTVLYVIAIVLLTALIIYPVIRGLLIRLVRYSEELLQANLETMRVLGGAIAKRDSDTDAHNYRVSIYSVRLAEAVGLPIEQIKSLIKGALLHDVGKLGIPDGILLKPGKLDVEEFEIMKTHVNHGIDITEGAEWLVDGQLVIAGHHEKFDGSGYPRGIEGDSIPVIARIFAIADVFDALTSKRPYKEPFSFDKTLLILEDSRGSHFDPKLLDAFILIAEKLYKTYSGEENDLSKEHLGTIIARYFH
jgi:HD-GYP domain-containing protein (c-di-GMP phosphodiesterase class II)